MNSYRCESLAIRERRDHAVEQARRELAELKNARDSEIRRLYAAGMCRARIAVELGCVPSAVYELLDEDLRQKNHVLRLDRYHLRAA
jgi:Fe2+ transport system protein FeoA